MRAVNLIPDDAGRDGRARSGGGAYVLLGVLAVALAGVAFSVLTNNTVLARRAELASLQTQAHAAQTQADAVRPYREFASLAQARVQTIRQLGAARFDWHGALAGLSKVVPDNVWLTSLLGTVAPGVNVDGASSGATGTLRAALPNPAIEMTGCTTSHDDVVRLLSRLRLMDGVVRVSLVDSAKGDSGSSADAGSSGDCRHGHAAFPQFDLVVFFAPLPTVPAPTGGTGAAAPAAGTAAPAAAATPAPAASTTPAPTGAAPSASGSVR